MGLTWRCAVKCSVALQRLINDVETSGHPLLDTNNHLASLSQHGMEQLLERNPNLQLQLQLLGWTPPTPVETTNSAPEPTQEWWSLFSSFPVRSPSD